MTNDPRMLSLLSLWARRREEGQEMAVEELCRDCPELTANVAACIQAMGALNELFPASNNLSTIRPNEAQNWPDTVVGPDGDPASPAFPIVPGYEILGHLGQGGMGVVYRARQSGLGRIVALKMIRGAHALPEEVQRFRSEAEAVARLRHPGIVQIFEIGHAGGQPFFSLEFAEGGSLDRKLAGKPIPAGDAAELSQKLARAMEAAHQANVVHRDLKPGNVLLSGGERGVLAPRGETRRADASTSEGSPPPLAGYEPKITDFGLARKLDEQRQTQTGAVLGTPSYMAPEQAEGKHDVGPLADVWALGAILYECLTGRPPFLASDPVETILQVICNDPVPPSRLNPTVPRDLETICLKCLEKDPARRYASAGQLADDLGRFLAGEPIRARPVGLAERGWRWCRRHRALASLYAVSAVAAVLLVGGAIWFTKRVTEERFGRLQADQRASAAEMLEATQRHFALVNQARERIARPQPGWSWKALDELKAAIPLGTKPDLVEIRSLAAQCLGAVDVCLAHSISLTTFSGAPEKVYALAWHPRGKWLAAAGFGEGLVGVVAGYHVVHLIDPQRPHQRRQLRCLKRTVWEGLRGYPDTINSVAFSPDGRWLVASTRSGQAFRWDLDQSNPKVQSLDVDRKELKWILFSPDGRAVYAGSDTAVKRLDFASWKETAVWTDNGLGRWGAIHPIDGWLGVRFPGGIHRFHPDTLKPVAAHLHAHRGLGSALAFTPDGRTVFVAAGRDILGFDASGDRQLQTIRAPDENHAHDADIDALAVSPDGTLLLSGSGPDVRLWDLVAGRLVARLPTNNEAVALAFAPDGRSFAVAVPGAMHVYEIRQRAQKIAGLCPSVVETFALPGQGVACITESDLPGRAEIAWWRDLNRPGQPPSARPGLLGNAPASYPLAAREGGRQLAVAMPHSGELQWLDAGNGLDPIPNQAPDCKQLAFAPGGDLWGAVNDQVRAWEVPSMKQTAEWKNDWGTVLRGRASIHAIAAGRRRVATAWTDGDVRTFPAGRGKLSPTAHRTLSQTFLTSVALSPDEELALVGDAKGGLWLIRVPSAEIVATLPSMSDYVASLAWAANDLVAAGSWNGTVRLWRRQGDTLRDLLSLRHDRPLRQVQFTPDGLRLGVLLQRERGVRLWQLDRLRDEMKALGLDLGLDVITGRPVPLADLSRTRQVMTDQPAGPNGLRTELFHHIDRHHIVHIRHDRNIDFNWGQGTADAARLRNDWFSIRWTGWLRPPRAGCYKLIVEADDEARVWLDGKLCSAVRSSRSDRRWPAGEVLLGDRPHELKLEYRHQTGDAYIRLRWSQIDGFAEQVVPPQALFHDRATAEKTRVVIDAAK